MDSRFVDLVRRNWQATAAVLVLLVFSVTHFAVFTPLLARYRTELHRAAELDMPLDPTNAPPPLSPRATALLTSNSLLPSVAEEQGTSGALTAGLLDRVTQLAGQCGLEVLTAEQGLVTQLPASVQVRAHLKLRGRYADFVGLLDELSRSQSLVTVDHFVLRSGDGDGLSIELWTSQVVLKRTRSTP